MRLSLLAVALLCVLGVPLFLGALELMGIRVASVDFFAYRYAVLTALDGRDVYASWVTGPGLDRQGLPYNYTPFALIPLLPAAISPWWLAYGLWSAATVAAVALSLALVWRRSLQCWWQLPLATATMLPTQILAHHLMFGQVNAFLTAICLLDVWALNRAPARWRRYSGVLIGIATAIKLTPGLFLIWLIVMRRWRAAAVAAGSTAACFLIGLILFPQSSLTFATQTFWELSGRVDLNHVFATSVNKSVVGLFASISGDLVGVGRIVMVLMVGGCLWAAVVLTRRGEALFGALVVGVGTTLASPLSWVHHWTYLLPLLVAVFVRARRWERFLCAVIYLGIVFPASGFAGLAGPVLPLSVLLNQWVLFSAVALVLLMLRISARERPGGSPALGSAPALA